MSWWGFLYFLPIKISYNWRLSISLFVNLIEEMFHGNNVFFFVSLPFCLELCHLFLGLGKFVTQLFLILCLLTFLFLQYRYLLLMLLEGLFNFDYFPFLFFDNIPMVFILLVQSLIILQRFLLSCWKWG